ncbi:MAG: tRNA pseudouridine(55) synthase TruB [Gemmatimonadota bacterium]
MRPGLRTDLSQPTDLTRGVWLVDKPVGPTSHAVVLAARRSLGVRRIGHTGTLDPFASGLLILCVGSVTRLVEYFHELPKTYLATVRLGAETSTDDRTGDVVSRSEAWREVSAETLEVALQAMTGSVDQMPPRYSAKRQEGRRAYELARAGEEFSLETKRVHVHELRLLSYAPPLAQLSAVVSTGTYIRAIARDLGHALGCGGHLAELRRTSIGPFDVGDAIAPDAFEALKRGPAAREGAVPGWLSAEQALPWLPVVDLSPEDAEHIRHGRRIETASAAPAAARVALYEGGRLLAVAQREGTIIRPEKVFLDH